MNLEAFHFLRPHWLLALTLLAPLAWWWRRQRSEAGGWRSVCDPHLLPHLLFPGSGGAAVAPFALLALGWSGACLAMAGPTWERLPQPAFGNPTRTVFVLSLAPSMDRDDVAPSRLARARHKLGDAIDRLEGGAVGLVVFREEAYGAVPLTDDAEVVREMLPTLRTDLAPGREVHPSRGLAEAGKLLDAVDMAGTRIVLVADGSDASPEATLDAARGLARSGATVSVLSVAPGDAPGLAAVAAAGDGAFATLTADDADLERLLASGPGAVPGVRLERSEVQADAWWDAGAWLVWLPLLLCSLAFRRGWVMAVMTLAWIGLPSAPARADVADWFERPDQRAARAFEAGRYAESAESFEDSAWRAAALYRADDFQRAAEALRALPDARSQYNLGNALARAGALEEALAAYDRSLAAAPGDDDARFNRDLVKRLLEQQRKEKSDSGSSGGDGAKSNEKSQNGASKEQAGGEKSPTDANEGAAEGEKNQADGQKDQAEGEKDQADGEKNQADGQKEQADAGESGEAPRADASEGDERSQEQRADASAGEESSQAQPADGSETAPDSSPPGDAEAAGAPPEAGGTPREASGTPHEASGTPREASGAPQQQANGSPDARSPRDPWLAHLPDDPGGLLREKLRRDYLRKREARLQGELP